MKKAFLMMIPLMMLASCKDDQKASVSQAVPAIDLTDLDTTVRPGDDFFMYATGGWQAKNPLKAEYARYGAFDALAEDNEIRLNELFSSMVDLKTVQGSVEQKIADLYKLGLDSTRLNLEGGAPLKSHIETIYAAADKSELAKVIAGLHLTGESSFFSMGVMEDLMNSDVQSLYFNQGGLGIGDRDYYLKEENAEIKKGYRDFLARIFTLSGMENAQTAADNALAVEEGLAQVSWTSVENRDIARQYNPMSIEQVAKEYSGFDFNTYLAACGIPSQDKAIVCQPSFFEGFSKLFAETELDALKDYVAGQLIQGACGALSDDYYAASFDFFSRQMRGITEVKPRWKRAMSVPNGILGEAVGEMYVAKYFPEEYKEKVLALVRNLQAAFDQHITGLDWMGDATKAYAREKLAAFTVKIGYPDKWKDYSALTIDPELSYYDNQLAAGKWYVADNLSKLGQPTDRDQWAMSPQTVNAYYNPTTNEICFPAAILQPPFFNPDADDAVNYGAIGVVICHEMTHGFDDQGRLFDKTGNMASWWTPEDEAAFNAKAEILAQQFDAIEILPGLHADGHLSLGENIADHGGISIAYTALQNSFNGVHPDPIDGFTAEQRFFLGYAHVWAQNITEEEMARRTKLDVHSLGNNRVNATLKNFQEFFDAFDIKEGDPMFRPESERVHIW